LIGCELNDTKVLKDKNMKSLEYLDLS